ncbi:MAG: hypothetical protein K2X32_12700 [Phycisphaerales bacterium]|nr:hypothetical protein [Phycisphaerales bacterium]
MAIRGVIEGNTLQLSGPSPWPDGTVLEFDAITPTRWKVTSVKLPLDSASGQRSNGTKARRATKKAAMRKSK